MPSMLPTFFVKSGIGGGAEHRHIYLEIGSFEIFLADIEGFGYGLQGIA